ncbi:glutamate receptor-like [Homarus americanus]|uniref:Glutamate receptor ionotropic, kainate 4-like 10 n=1 Tax=Homarus americanus TaxID=6706 RepID=A0A8J5MT77_HOMAM|nr:glutamate receptor-like [Homarus americanus]KAG7162652.1 Glutamate receptor ionotropic, kainate 4-like 10 [Homarus americanus]
MAPSSPKFLAFSLFVLVVDHAMGQVGVSVDQVDEQVAIMVSKVVEHHLAGCHLVVATTTQHTPVFFSTLRKVASGVEAVVVVEMEALFTSQDSPAQQRLLQEVWGDARATCRALILNLNKDSHLAFRFLEATGVWQWPETRVVVVGERTQVKVVLHHPSLRNTIHTLYLAFYNLALYACEAHTPNTRLRMTRTEKARVCQQQQHVVAAARRESVEVYRRCLYCNNGDADIVFLYLWPLTSANNHHYHNQLFPERLENFMGHKFVVVTLPYFPFIAFEKESEEGGALSPRDSLNTRMINTMARCLNFTYMFREPLDGTWGVPTTGGNWTGIVGDLQHQLVDFSLDLTPTAARMEIISFTRIYTDDPLVILSLKPGPLPRYLALLRPFTRQLWLMVMMSTTTLGFTLWLLQKAWSWVSGGSGLWLSTAHFYIWGTMLENPPDNAPANLTSRVLFGLCLLTCMVINIGYRSSLIAHLTVQSKTQPINCFQDLLKEDNWAWGSFEFVGTTFLYFNESFDPLIQRIGNEKETLGASAGLERVLMGKFSFITSKTNLLTDVVSLYADRYGNIPFHISTTHYQIQGGDAWGVRKGAPFLRQLSKMTQRMIEVGMIDRWTKDVVYTHITLPRSRTHDAQNTVYSQESDDPVVLGLNHLQGAFYLLILGHSVSLLILLGENLTQYLACRGRTSPSTSPAGGEPRLVPHLLEENLV